MILAVISNAVKAIISMAVISLVVISNAVSAISVSLEVAPKHVQPLACSYR
jgi:hypothetical protein